MGERTSGGRVVSLTGDETVDEIVAVRPELRLPLLAYGLCTCRGGGLTLRQHSRTRGLPFDALLRELNQEPAVGR